MPVTQDDVALVRRAFEAFEMRRETIDEYFERFWHPDAVIESADAFPVPGRYEGLAGYRQWFDDSYGPYDDVRRELHAIEAVGRRVVLLLTVSGRRQHDDVLLEVEVGSTYEVEQGRIRRMCVYLRHERALEAARGDRA